MNISDIKIRKVITDGRLRAIISITVDNLLAIHDIKVIEGPNRLFVAMPSRKDDGGIYRDIVHPISKEGRDELEEVILNYYHQYMLEHKDHVDEMKEANKE